MNTANEFFSDPHHFLKEAAAILRKSVKTLSRERTRGRLQSFKLGGRVCILESEIRAYRERSINKANGGTQSCT
jgi:hypothetical protein